MKELNARLKSGKIDRVYALFGSEPFLILAYQKRIVSAIFGGETEMMNISTFEGKDCEVQEIINSSETLPFFSPARLVIVKDSGLLQAGRKDASERLSGYIQEIPDYTVLLLLETKDGAVDKRLKLYKKIAEVGCAAEFATPSEKELAVWLSKIMESKGKKLPAQAAYALIRYAADLGSAGGKMEFLHTEALKLAAYLGDKKEAGIEDIEAVCTKSLQANIFDIVKDIGGKNLNALNSFSNLIYMKESPLMVLSMIARQFRLILLCGGLSKDCLNPNQIADKTGLRRFIVDGCMRQYANFTENILVNALNDCLEADIGIKTGKIAGQTAVEMLIVKYCLA